MAKLSGKRPVTRAKDIVESVPIKIVGGVGTYNFTPEQRDELWRLLHVMDASTGKPDTKRKQHRRKPATTKATTGKKAGARRR